MIINNQDNIRFYKHHHTCSTHSRCKENILKHKSMDPIISFELQTKWRELACSSVGITMLKFIITTRSVLSVETKELNYQHLIL